MTRLEGRTERESACGDEKEGGPLFGPARTGRRATVGLASDCNQCYFLWPARMTTGSRSPMREGGPAGLIPWAGPLPVLDLLERNTRSALGRSGLTGTPVEACSSSANEVSNYFSKLKRKSS